MNFSGKFDLLLKDAFLAQSGNFQMKAVFSVLFVVG